MLNAKGARMRPKILEKVRVTSTLDCVRASSNPPSSSSGSRYSPGVEPRDLLAGGIGAGRIVGVGDEHDLGLVRHRGQDRIDIGRIVAIGDDHRRRADAPRRDLIHRKAVADVDDLVARPGEGAGGQVQHLVRSSAIDQSLRLDAVMAGKRAAQVDRGGVGIALQMPRRVAIRRPRALGRTERILVRRQLDDLAAVLTGGATGDVGGDAQDPGLRGGGGCGVRHGREP
ncbi:hypothetical protein WR25_08594 [Diploscapter pachys]|uniref:Uncharacterized protein n=1 Tax=Diploscapter pachys TaxID=2018661 RepID=A0A2A2K5N6_9BILA|nr:hypothetical protein WR25_08594 [Diploscapter pachys]